MGYLGRYMRSPDGLQSVFVELGEKMTGNMTACLVPR
jgi:hypothetical protein